MNATIGEARFAAMQYYKWRRSTWRDYEPLLLPDKILTLLWRAHDDTQRAPDLFCRRLLKPNVLRDVIAPSAWHAACYLIVNDLLSRNTSGSNVKSSKFVGTP
jgi:hypothetical protein